MSFIQLSSSLKSNGKLWCNNIFQLSTVAADFCSDPSLGGNIEMPQNLRGFEADLSKEGAGLTLVIALSAKS